MASSHPLTLCLLLATIDFILSSDEIPKFTKDPQSVIVKPRGKVVLHCAVDDATAQIRWKYNGNYISTNQDDGVIITGGTLHIKSFKHSKRHKPHAGKYQCIANTSLGAVASLPAEVRKAGISRFDQGAPDIIVNVTQGNVALVPCTPPESHPTPIITFEVNSTIIDHEFSVRHKILPSGSLQIENARHIDQGYYVCRAENPMTGQIREAYHKVMLRILNPVVNQPPRVVQTPLKKSEVMIGSNLTLECVMNGAPVPVINWDKYGGIIPEGRHMLEMGNLHLYNIQVQDEGTYICRAENGQGAPQAGIAMVEVLELPSINQAPEDQTVTEGDTVSFDCLATGKPKVKTSWLYNGQPVFRDSSITITEVGPSNETTLTLHRVNMNQAGFYQCMAQSRVGIATAAARLHVKKRKNPPPKSGNDKDGATVKPQAIAPDHEPNYNAITRPTINIGPSNTTAPVGQMVTLLCLTEGATRVSWLKDGVPIDYAINERHDVSAADSLQIYNVQVTDSGEYVCLASNRVGFTTASAYVDITDSSTNAQLPGLFPRPANKDSSETDSSTVTTTTASPGNENATATTAAPTTSTTTTTTTMVEKVILGGNSTGNKKPKKQDQDDFFTDIQLYDYDDDSDDIIIFATTRSPSQRLQTMPPFGVEDNRRRKQRKHKKKDRERERDRGRERNRKKKKNRAGDVKMVPPSKPKVTKLSDNSVMLQWTIADNDGLRITFFRVQYREQSNQKKRGDWETIEDDIPENVRQYEVAGLKPGAMYKFRIAAVYSNNDNKVGPSSDRFKLNVKPAIRPNPPVAGPVIVEAKSVSANAIAIRWKYLPIGTIVVEGFFIYYKPYGTEIPYKKQEVWGGNLVNYVLSRLRPDTEYQIRMQCFNSAGNSDFSNTVVKRTLTTSGSSGSFPGEPEYYPDGPVKGNPFSRDNNKNIYDGKAIDVDLGGKPELDPTEGYEEDQFERKMNTQSSSMLLYMVLGIVLGVMMLLLVIFMVMCGLKQRQQRRMMAELDASMRHKFNDPSQRIHNDNIRKKYMNGGFALNSIHQNGIYANGSIRNGYIPGQDNGSKINISVNPMTTLDSNHYPEQNGTLKSNGDIVHNLHEILNGDVIYNSLERHSHGPPSHHESSENVNPPPPEEPKYSTGHNRIRQSTFKPEPPDPSRIPIPNRSHEQLNPNYDPYDCVNNMPHNSYSRSHDQIPKSPYDFSPRATDYYHHSLTHTPQHAPPDQNGGGYSNNLNESPQVRHKRRRRSRDRANMRDQATNTDYSSNDGTLDQHSLTYRSLDTLRREEAYHRRSPIICPDIPQVHDYSDYNFE